MKQSNHTYPEFMRIVDLISTQNPLQSKRINNFISQQDEDYWIYAEEVCRTLNRSFLQDEKARISAARSYNRMSMDFLREQIRFRKTGVYPLNDANVARKNVYNQSEVMRYYMVGLFLSYLLWPNHFAMLRFFRTHIQRISAIDNYIDIAPGHGLFAVEVMRRFPDLEATLLDISETSLQLTSEILTAFQIDLSRLNFIHGDFLSVPVDNNGFDFISMGEVLEHVNDAPGFLDRACRLLHPRGAIFMSTCANAPAIDHVYHFRNVNEIRKIICDAGLFIVEEEILPSEAIPEDQWEKELITVNYCAVLVKNKRESVWVKKV